MLSTSEGKVVSISIAGDNTVTDLFPSLLQPTAIAIDWLADRVYVASRNRVTAASSSGRFDLVLHHLDLRVQFFPVSLSSSLSVHVCVCVCVCVCVHVCVWVGGRGEWKEQAR